MIRKSWKFGIASIASILSLAGCSGSTGSSATYTYNTYLATSPNNWNVHNWQTSDESYITSFTEIGLYDVILNANKNGYEFVPEMAADMPKAIDPADITDAEMDTYYSSIGNLTDNMVWDIPLNQAAVWEDGTKITADDYIKSMELQLDPDYANYRADSYYDGNMILVNAENFYKQGRQTIEPYYGNFDSNTGNVPNDSGFYFLNLGKYTPYVNTVFNNADETTNFYSILNQVGSTYGVQLECERIIVGYSYYLWKISDHKGSSVASSWESVKDPTQVSSTMISNDAVDIDIEDFDTGFTDFQGFQDTIKTIKALNIGWEEGNIEEYSLDALKSDLRKVVSAVGRNKGATSKNWAWKLPLFTYLYTYEGEPLTMDDVGIKKINDYTIRLYLTKAITELNLKFALTGNWLVKTDLYERLSTTLATGSKATTYASNSASNYMSYGPYRLSYFEAGKQIIIVRNENWYGYKDGKHEGQFQMDEIDTHIYTDHTTALQEFMAGRLDDIDLTVSDFRTYGTSGRCTTTYESYTQKISFNSDYEKLKSRQQGNDNKTILSNKDFRKGLSLAIDRNQFASQATSGSKGFTGLLNDLYLANNSTGESYRSTAQGKSVYGKVYGHLGGEVIDEVGGAALAENAVGYNNALAIQYIAKGLKEELQSSVEGHLVAGNTINIEFRVYDDSAENTVAAYNFITKTWSDAITSAIGLLKDRNDLNDSETLGFKISMVKDQDYYTTAQNGGYDMIFSIWGGAAVNPYGLMEVYCDNTHTSCCEYGFKGHQAETYLDIDANGDGNIDVTNEHRSFHDWYTAMNSGDEFSEAVYGDGLQPGDENYEAWYEVHNKKLNVLAGLEAGILSRFEAVPLVARGTSSLLGFKVENATDTYVSLVGYGGIRFMTFNYTNEQWSSFCAENNNSLSNLYRSYQR